MSVENLVDSIYRLFVKTADEAPSYTKLPHLLKCEPPVEDPVLDDVTATDDRRTVKVPVDFTEDSEIEFEYVLDATNPVHMAIQDAFDNRTELDFKYVYVTAPKMSRGFKAMVVKLTPDAEDKKKKMRMKGTLSITSDPTVLETSDPVVAGQL